MLARFPEGWRIEAKGEGKYCYSSHFARLTDRHTGRFFIGFHTFMVRRQRPSQCVSNKAHIGPHQHVWLSMAVFSCCLSIHNPPLHVHDTHLFWIQACKPYLPIVCEFALKSQSLWHLCPVVIGALYSCCREHKYNKLVLAQHLDDLAESFFMSAMRNGQVLRHLGIACWACVQSAAAYYWAPSGAKYYEAVV